MYTEEILDHYRYPQNYGVLPHATNSTSTKNVSCGDEISIYLNVEDGIIKDISFTAQGCAISIASASLLTSYVKNKTVEYVLNLGTGDILQLLGLELTPTRLKCALLSLETVQQALAKK